MLPHFIGRACQRGSEVALLAAGVSRAALPFAKQIILLAVKRIGKKIFMQSLPEHMDVATNETSAKRALNLAVKKTVKK